MVGFNQDNFELNSVSQAHHKMLACRKKINHFSVLDVLVGNQIKSNYSKESHHCNSLFTEFVVEEKRQTKYHNRNNYQCAVVPEHRKHPKQKSAAIRFAALLM